MSFFERMTVGLRQGLLADKYTAPLVNDKSGIIAQCIETVSLLSTQSTGLLGDQIRELLLQSRHILIQMGSTKFARTMQASRFQKEVTRSLLGPSLNTWAAVYGFETINPKILSELMVVGQAYTDAWYGTTLLSLKKLQVIFPDTPKETLKTNQQELTKQHLQSTLTRALSGFPFSENIKKSILQVITGNLKFLSFLDIMMSDISQVTADAPDMREMMFQLCTCLAAIVSHFKLHESTLHFFNEASRKILEHTWEDYRVLFKRDHSTPTDAFLHYHLKATLKLDGFLEMFEPDAAQARLTITPQLSVLKADNHEPEKQKNTTPEEAKKVTFSHIERKKT